MKRVVGAFLHLFSDFLGVSTVEIVDKVASTFTVSPAQKQKTVSTLVYGNLDCKCKLQKFFR